MKNELYTKEDVNKLKIRADERANQARLFRKREDRNSLIIGSIIALVGLTSLGLTAWIIGLVIKALMKYIGS